MAVVTLLFPARHEANADLVVVIPLGQHSRFFRCGKPVKTGSSQRVAGLDVSDEGDGTGYQPVRRTMTDVDLVSTSQIRSRKRSEAKYATQAFKCGLVRY